MGFFGSNPKPKKGLKKFLDKKRDVHEILEKKNPGVGAGFDGERRLLKPKNPFIKDKSNVIRDAKEGR